MIRHFFKLLWKQRRKNSLLMVEIVFSFIALFILSSVLIHYYKRYKEPVGMDYKNLWAITISQDWELPKEQRLGDSLKFIKFNEIKQHLLEISNIQSVSFATFNDFIYAQSSSSNCFNLKGKQYCFDNFDSEPDFAKTTGLKIIEGRWLMPEDRISEKPAKCVINNKLKLEIFGNSPASGKVLTADGGYQIKIVGVFEHLKRHGEFAEEPNFMATAVPKNTRYFPFGGMLIRLKGSISKDFEANLINNLQKSEKAFTYRVEKLETMHRQYMLAELAPIIIASAVVIFLIVNVMLGLFGSLWLNISKRKAEIGLRRALGSTGFRILLQLLGESYILAIVSILLGFVFTSQIFIFNMFDTPVSTLMEGNIAAFLIIFLLCTFSAFIPAQLAASLQPAEALHED